MSEHDLAAVAQQTYEVSVAAGEVFAREGDAGDEFFVIESGHGHPRGHTGRDEARATSSVRSALIREERRTATVTASSPTVIIAMKGSNSAGLDCSVPEVSQTVSDRSPGGARR